MGFVLLLLFAPCQLTIQWAKCNWSARVYTFICSNELRIDWESTKNIIEREWRAQRKKCANNLRRRITHVCSQCIQNNTVTKVLLFPSPSLRRTKRNDCTYKYAHRGGVEEERKENQTLSSQWIYNQTINNLSFCFVTKAIKIIKHWAYTTNWCA